MRVGEGHFFRYHHKGKGGEAGLISKEEKSLARGRGAGRQRDSVASGGGCPKQRSAIGMETLLWRRGFTNNDQKSMLDGEDLPRTLLWERG